MPSFVCLFFFLSLEVSEQDKRFNWYFWIFSLHRSDWILGQFSLLLCFWDTSMFFFRYLSVSLCLVFASLSSILSWNVLSLARYWFALFVSYMKRNEFSVAFSVGKWSKKTMLLICYKVSLFLQCVISNCVKSRSVLQSFVFFPLEPIQGNLSLWDSIYAYKIARYVKTC